MTNETEFDARVNAVIEKTGLNASDDVFRQCLIKKEVGISERSQKKLLSRFRHIRADAFFARVAKRCRVNPSVSDIANVIKDDPNPDQLSAKHVYRVLKERYPNLWSDGGNPRFAVRPYLKDRNLIDNCAKMLGTSAADSVCIVHRALLLASYRGEINLVETLARAKTLTPEELEVLDRIPIFTLENI